MIYDFIDPKKYVAIFSMILLVTIASVINQYITITGRFSTIPENNITLETFDDSDKSIIVNGSYDKIYAKLTDESENSTITNASCIAIFKNAHYEMELDAESDYYITKISTNEPGVFNVSIKCSYNSENISTNETIKITNNNEIKLTNETVEKVSPIFVSVLEDRVLFSPDLTTFKCMKVFFINNENQKERNFVFSLDKNCFENYPYDIECMLNNTQANISIFDAVNAKFIVRIPSNFTGYLKIYYGNSSYTNDLADKSFFIDLSIDSEKQLSYKDGTSSSVSITDFGNDTMLIAGFDEDSSSWRIIKIDSLFNQLSSCSYANVQPEGIIKKIKSIGNSSFVIVGDSDYSKHVWTIIKGNESCFDGNQFEWTKEFFESSFYSHASDIGIYNNILYVFGTYRNESNPGSQRHIIKKLMLNSSELDDKWLREGSYVNYRPAYSLKIRDGKILISEKDSDSPLVSSFKIIDPHDLSTNYSISLTDSVVFSSEKIGDYYYLIGFNNSNSSGFIMKVDPKTNDSEICYVNLTSKSSTGNDKEMEVLYDENLDRIIAVGYYNSSNVKISVYDNNCNEVSSITYPDESFEYKDVILKDNKIYITGKKSVGNDIYWYIISVDEFGMQTTENKSIVDVYYTSIPITINRKGIIDKLKINFTGDPITIIIKDDKNNTCSFYNKTLIDLRNCISPFSNTFRVNITAEINSTTEVLSLSVNFTEPYRIFIGKNNVTKDGIILSNETTLSEIKILPNETIYVDLKKDENTYELNFQNVVNSTLIQIVLPLSDWVVKYDNTTLILPNTTTVNITLNETKNITLKKDVEIPNSYVSIDKDNIEISTSQKITCYYSDDTEIKNVSLLIEKPSGKIINQACNSTLTFDEIGKFNITLIVEDIFNKTNMSSVLVNVYSSNSNNEKSGSSSPPPSVGGGARPVLQKTSEEKTDHNNVTIRIEDVLINIELKQQKSSVKARKVDLQELSNVVNKAYHERKKHKKIIPIDGIKVELNESFVNAEVFFNVSMKKLNELNIAPNEVKALHISENSTEYLPIFIVNISNETVTYKVLVSNFSYIVLITEKTEGCINGTLICQNNTLMECVNGTWSVKEICDICDNTTKECKLIYNNISVDKQEENRTKNSGSLYQIGKFISSNKTKCFVFSASIIFGVFVVFIYMKYTSKPSNKRGKRSVVKKKRSR